MSKTQSNYPLEEQALIARILLGDSLALSQWYRTLSPVLSRYIATKVSEPKDVEEIVHDCLLSALDALPTFGGRSSLKTFVFSIANHEIADYYRRKYAKKALRHVPFVDQVYKEPLFSFEDTKELIDKTLLSLSETDRQLVIWKYQDNLSVATIADRLGISHKATESRLFRARQSFKEAYVKISA